MAEFYTSLSREELATQIAGLVNAYNNLTRIHTTGSILSSPAKYFVEIYENKVIGCVGLTKVNEKESKAHHGSVHPDYRKRGVGKKLLKLAVIHCETPLIYGTIRENNIASLRMSFSVGFKAAQRIYSRGHSLILVKRMGGLRSWEKK